MTKLELREVTFNRFGWAAINQSHRLCHLIFEQLFMKYSNDVPGFKPTSLNPKPRTISTKLSCLSYKKLFLGQLLIYNHSIWENNFPSYEIWVDYLNFIYLLDLIGRLYMKTWYYSQYLSFLNSREERTTGNWIWMWQNEWIRRVWTDIERVG